GWSRTPRAGQARLDEPFFLSRECSGMFSQPSACALELQALKKGFVFLLVGRTLPILERFLELRFAGQKLSFAVPPTRQKRPRLEQRLMGNLDQIGIRCVSRGLRTSRQQTGLDKRRDKGARLIWQIGDARGLADEGAIIPDSD